MRKFQIQLFLFFIFSAALKGQSFQWAKLYTSGHEGFSVCNDLQGNVYLAGFVGGTVATADFTISTPGSNAILIKQDPNGNVVWVRSFNKASAMGVSADFNGNILVTGTYSISTVIGTTTLLGTSGWDTFLVKYDTNGNVIWAKSGNGPGQNDISNSVSTDAQGNSYITGFFSGATFTAGGSVLGSASNSQYFLIKYDPNGNVLWARSGTSGIFISSYVSTDNNDDVIIVGHFSLTAVIGTNTITSAGVYDFFVTKYNAAGNVLWTTTGGGTGTELGHCVSTDPANNIYITGSYGSPTFSIGLNTYSLIGVIDAYLTKFDGNGTMIWTKTMGSPNPDIGYGLASYLGGVYVAGKLGMGGMSVGNNTLFTTSNVDGMFLIHYDNLGNPLYSTSLNGGGDDVMALSLDNYCNLYLGGDLATNPTVVGNFTLVPTVSEALFVGKFNTGLPTPTINISGNFTICSGVSTTLTGSGANYYIWMNGSTNPSIALSPTITTNYLLTGSSASLGCSSKTIATVVVLPAPTVSAITIGTLCSGSSATLIASGANTYSWTNGPQTASVVVTPATTSVYTVSGVSNFGCNYVVTQTVVVNQNPNLTISASNTVLCSGRSATISVSGAGTYSWNNGSQTASIVVSPGSTSSYSVSAIAVNGCSSSAVQNISVNPTPTLSIVSTSTLLCKGERATLTVSGANTYSWSTSSQLPSFSLSATASSVYSVSGTNTMGGCTATAALQVSVAACTALIKNDNLCKVIALFPNPFSTDARFIFDHKTKNVEITVFDCSGKVLTRQFYQNSDEIIINRDLLEAGLYFYQIAVEKQLISSGKFVVYD